MANNIKGITIEIGGNTQKLQDALRTVNKDIRSTENELKMVEKGLKLDPTNVTLLAQKQELLTKAVSETTAKLKTLEEAKRQADASDDVDKNTESYRALVREIEATKQKLDGYNKSLDDHNDKAEESNEKTSSFLSKIKDMSSGLADVKAGLDMMAAAAKSAMSAVDKILDAGRLADDINTLAKQFNMTTEQVQIFQKSADLVDVSFETIAGSYNKLTKAMTSKSASAEFKKIGVSVKNADGSLRDVNDVFFDTISALSKVENETEKDTIAMNLFGKKASDLATIIDDGGESLSNLSQTLKDNNMILSQESLDTLNGMNDAYDSLQITLGSLGSQIGLIFAEPMTEALSYINELATNLFTYLSELDLTEFYATLELVWTWFKDNIIPVFDVVIEKAGDYLPKALDELKKNFEFVWDIVTLVWDVLKKLWETMEDTGAVDVIIGALDLFFDIVARIRDALHDAVNWLKELLSKQNEVSSFQVNGRTYAGGGRGFSSGGFGELQFATTINISGVQSLTSADAEQFGEQIVEYVNSKLGRRI